MLIKIINIQNNMDKNKLDVKTIEEYVEKTGKKIKVLWLSDTPTCATGFGCVAKNILKVLNKTGLFEFDVVGINYDGTPHDLPYKIYPALNALKAQNPGYNDLYGRQEVLDMLGTGQYDLFFSIQDTFIIEPMVKAIEETSSKMPMENKFKTMFYFPIDAVPKESWIKDCVSKFDYPIAYTNYAYEECVKKDESLREKLSVIYHGTNIDDFKVVEKIGEKTIAEIRDKFFLKENRDKFIFMNLNRNQPRKDLVRTMRAFSILHKERPNTFLYLHCQAIDAGGNLFELDKQFGLQIAKDWSCPNPEHFQANQGYSIEMINALYNCCQCVVSTSLGEGWGLSYTEAFATKRPLIGPANTSFPEICGEQGERALKVDSGSNDNLWSAVLPGDNERLRPLTDVYDLVEKMKWVIDNPDKVALMKERAFQWAVKHRWDGEEVGGKWLELFKKAAFDNLVARGYVGSKKIGRNELCPCNSGKKYKKCCGK